MRSSVSSASMLAHAARRWKSCASAARSRAGRRARRAAMRARISTSVSVIGAKILMEIAGRRAERPEQRAVVHEAPGDEVNYFTIALDGALDAEEPRAEKFTPLALDEPRPHHNVDVAELVFQRDEYHAARRIRPLPAGDETGNSGARAVRQGAHRLCVHH